MNKLLLAPGNVTTSSMAVCSTKSLKSYSRTKLLMPLAQRRPETGGPIEDAERIAISAGIPASFCHQLLTGLFFSPKYYWHKSFFHMIFLNSDLLSYS